MLTLRDRHKNLELNGDLSKTITNKNNSVDLANLSNKKLVFEIAKDMFFDEKVLGKKINRNKSTIRLPKSSAVIVLVSGVSSSFKMESSPKPKKQKQEFHHPILQILVVE